MRALIYICCFFLFVSSSLLLAAQDTKDTADKKPIPKAEQSVTHHSIVINGKTISYTATAGTFIVHNDKDEPEASFGYFAYIKDGEDDPGTRPITFAYNGGPGSSSIWLHFGALGPRRIVLPDAQPAPPPPYSVVDNQFSILDKTDLIMVDPIGTGFSKAVGKKKDEDYWGVDPDISSISTFIIQYITQTGRWNSPKYLLGESYGTTRSAGIVNYLQNSSMAFNGVILVSSAMDLGLLWGGDHDRPYPLFLPTYTAVSWYHKVLPNQPKEMEPLLDEVRKFALGTYASFLIKGNNVTEAEKDAIAEKIHEYTGLSVKYIKDANLRVSQGQYSKEIMREFNVTVGRLDARYTGVSLDKLSEYAEYDPQSSEISPAFTSSFMDYLHKDLKFGDDKTYHIFGNLTKWDMKHNAPGDGEQELVNTDFDLARAMNINPGLKVMVLQGYFDLATPFLATEYMLSHLDLDTAHTKNLEIHYFQAGHMMYLHPESLELMKKDISDFIDKTNIKKN